MNLSEIILFLKDIKKRDNSICKIDEITDLLKTKKTKFVSDDNQEEAKNIWCLEQVLKIQNLYLKAFNLMKEEKFYDAWCNLEQCEISLHLLYPHFSCNYNIYFLDFIDQHINKYQSLYPYKIFMSNEMIIKKSLCNICKKEISIRNSCGHKLGEIYNGKMCSRVITDFEFLGISMVFSPLHKYTVPFICDEKTGEKRDHYNYSLVKYAMKGIQSPFDPWDIEWSKIRHPHSYFKDIGKNDKCPCNSGKIYKKCCLKKPGVLRPHCEFKFSTPVPEDLERIKYIY